MFPVAVLIHPPGENLATARMGSWASAQLLLYISISLLQLGLVGLYARQVDQAGWLGLVVFILLDICLLFV
ncbi:MAG: hypothetical protein PVG14_01595 [Anaerolineales bacterium]